MLAGLLHPQNVTTVLYNETVLALKQFCHYLLGKSFQIHTDHEPLQWLLAQKMEDTVC